MFQLIPINFRAIRKSWIIYWNFLYIFFKGVWISIHTRLSLVKFGWFAKANRWELCIDLISNHNHDQKSP